LLYPPLFCYTAGKVSDEPRFPNKFLIAGIAFCIVGAVLLLWTGGYLGGIVVLWPVVPLVAGLILLYVVFQKDGPEAYVFLGTLFLLVGILVLLLNTVMSEVTLERIWPLFMTITGLSLLAYARKKRGYARLSLTIPSIAIVVLSGIFLPFSLDLIQRNFIAFVGTWWPTLLIVLGLVLLITDLTRRRKSQ
jgi:hypothetical protein